MVTNGISIDWKRAKYIRTIEDRLKITRDDMKYTIIHLVRRGVYKFSSFFVMRQ